MDKSGYTLALLVAATGVLVLAHGDRAMAGPWDMDTTFGAGGLVAYDSGVPMWIKSLQDGTLLEVMSTPTGVELRHRDVNGKPDSTFGAGGKIEITFPIGFGTYDRLPLVDSNGRFLWCGAMDTNNDKILDRAILRFTVAGGLDPAFGVGGIVSQVSAPFPVPNSGTYGDRCDSLAVQSDGRIVAAIARYEQFYGDAISLTLLRFNQDGGTDSTFGAGTGAVQIPTRYFEGGSNVRVLPNGWITVMDGIRDATFTASGTSTSGPKDNPFLPGSSYIYDDPIEWQVLGIPGSTDMLLVGNDNSKRLLVAREHSDGSIDMGFGTSGIGFTLVEAEPPAGTYYSFVTASLSQDGIRLYIVRYDSSLLGEMGGGQIVRLIASGARAGQFDPDFGAGGRVDWPFPGFVLTEQSPAAVVLNGPGGVLRLSQTAGPSPGILGFTNGGLAAGPENTSYDLRVVRAAGHDGVASVAYQTLDISDSGKVGVNYESASGTLRWADGDAVDQHITLKLLKGASNVIPGFVLRLDHPQGAVLVADEMNIGVKATSPAPVTLPVVPASTPGVPGVAAGGGATDPLTLLLFLLGGSASLRVRARSKLN